MRLLPLVLALAAAPAAADAPAHDVMPPAIAACLDARFAALVPDTTPAVGLSVAIESADGRWRWAGARGVANAASGEALTPGHAFRIASNTKTYTAAGVLRLVEQGRLAPDDAIAGHLPDDVVATLRAGGYDPAAIRVRHLLTHTAGLREHVDEAFLRRQAGTDARAWTAKEQVALAMEKGPPLSAPGEAFHYSDTGYVLLGMMVERHAGQPLPAALRALQQWDARGLAHTWFETQEPARAPQVHQQWQGEDTRDWHPSFDLYGGGGLLATPADMAAFLRLLLAGELFDDAASLAAMRTPGVEGAWNDYGAGLFRLSPDGGDFVGHSGFWNSFAFASPDDGVVIAGAVVEKTALPYADLLVGLRRAWRDCRDR